MAKFIPKLIKENVNVVKADPLTTFIKAVTGLCVLVIAAYILLVAVTETVIFFVPVKVNYALGSTICQRIKTPPHLTEVAQAVQPVLDQMVAVAGLEDLSFQVVLLEDEDLNALAMPGGKIVVTTGLLKALSWENELAMIFGHELGHYRNNDHLRGLSRGVILMGLFGLLEVSGARGAMQVAESSVGLFDFSYSRHQEKTADAYALDLVNRHYGHVTGAAGVYAHLYEAYEKITTLNGWLTTHPISAQRQSLIGALIRKHRYSVLGQDQLIPLSITIPDAPDDADSPMSEEDGL